MSSEHVGTTIQPAVDPLAKYFRGEALYGDDFTLEEIGAWYEDEREGFADIYQDETGSKYPFHAQNRVHGYDQIPSERRFARALGFGSAFGDELLPVANRIDVITIIDPSDHFVRKVVGGTPAEWVKPQPSGTLPFADASFDLITCFGVLHHVPNVSHVARELGRVLRPGGYLLVREPVVSMGDWRVARRGLTKRERGIPRALFRGIMEHAGMRVVRATPCMFPPLTRIFATMGINSLSHRWLVRLDRLLCWLFYWNYKYHARGVVARFSPASEFYVLTRA